MRRAEQGLKQVSDGRLEQKNTSKRKVRLDHSTHDERCRFEVASNLRQAEQSVLVAEKAEE
jgi:hypothetical protein